MESNCEKIQNHTTLKNVHIIGLNPMKLCIQNVHFVTLHYGSNFYFPNVVLIFLVHNLININAYTH